MLLDSSGLALVSKCSKIMDRYVRYFKRNFVSKLKEVDIAIVGAGPIGIS